MLLNEPGAIGLAGIVLLIWLSLLSFWLYKTAGHYTRLVKATGKVNLRSALEKLLSDQKELEAHLGKIEDSIAEIGKAGEAHFQRMGVVRFNPFRETGGDQSFALALLDSEDSGVVILSLHSREGTRIYAKPVKNGKSRYDLSKEEVKAIEEARKAK